MPGIDAVVGEDIIGDIHIDIKIRIIPQGLPGSGQVGSIVRRRWAAGMHNRITYPIGRGTRPVSLSIRTVNGDGTRGLAYANLGHSIG